MWKDVVGYEGLYEVSHSGIVRNARTKYELHPTMLHDGYLQVRLYKNGGNKATTVHRIVALTFIPNPECLETVNHKNENKTDNRVENLEWMSRADNMAYGSRVERGAKKRMKKIKGIDPAGVSYVFNSLKDAAIQTNTNRCSISLTANGHYKRTKNKWRWEFA